MYPTNVIFLQTDNMMAVVQTVQAGVFSRLRSQLPLVVQSRTATRHIIYGVEEGHDTKNEVRKDRWIRKRKRKALGGVWREDQGLPSNIHSEGPLIDDMDWSFADGRPGVPSFPQIKRMYKQKQYATEIKAALDLVKSYQEANTKLQLEKEEEVKQYTTSKLKQKGHQPL
ncbi:39S ribosomal protein L52, mitochondrial [Eurytemora carolleeae]|uniref:39S ribosomal protein L52, mitochondrial n=1 Tax=Eurytemora carolleeae TaxID=1294199 RepID=UPI000C783573|nr:39S ribosomal protein L52, mitochondrial [Eurytemora carolleeae]|eukprot:XP_023327638.1 39S ribosomal protein L52, mitochondrial-like [Eurytemora affinis]